MRCCRNSAPPTAGASQPYPAGGRGIADSLTISAVSAGALVSTNVRVFCSPAGMSSRSRCAISSMLAATQDGFFCQKCFLSRSSGFLLRVRNQMFLESCVSVSTVLARSSSAVCSDNAATCAVMLGLPMPVAVKKFLFSFSN